MVTGFISGNSKNLILSTWSGLFTRIFFFFCGSKIDAMTVSYKVNMAISLAASLTELMWAASKNVLIVLNEVQNAHSRQVFLHFPHQFYCSCTILC